MVLQVQSLSLRGCRWRWRDVHVAWISITLAASIFVGDFPITAADESWEILHGCCRTATGGHGELLAEVSFDTAANSRCKRLCVATPGCVAFERRRTERNRCDVLGGAIETADDSRSCRCYVRSSVPPPPVTTGLPTTTQPTPASSELTPSPNPAPAPAPTTPGPVLPTMAPTPAPTPAPTTPGPVLPTMAPTPAPTPGPTSGPTPGPVAPTQPVAPQPPSTAGPTPTPSPRPAGEINSNSTTCSIDPPLLRDWLRAGCPEVLIAYG